MASMQPWIIKDLASDGGFKSRKLWAFIITLAAGVPLAWFNKLSGEEIAMFLGLFAMYCTGNLAAKQIVTGRNLRRLFTSTAPQVEAVPQPIPTPAPVPAPAPEKSMIEETRLAKIAELNEENEKLKDQLMRRSELVDLKSQHELWREQMLRRAEIDELKRENERLKEGIMRRIQSFDEME